MQRHLSKEHRRKIGLAHKGKKNPRWGKPSPLRGLTYEEYFGERRAKKIKSKIRNAATGRKWSKAERKRMSRQRRGKGNGMYGKTHTPETRALLSRITKRNFRNGTFDMSGENNPMYGKPISDFHRKAISGKNNVNWNGGTTFEHYASDFGVVLKRRIRERDRYRCLICGKKANVVHHIDYDKDNCSEENLCVLCNRHNAYVNSDRVLWKKYLSKLVRGYYVKSRKIRLPLEVVL